MKATPSISGSPFQALHDYNAPMSVFNHSETHSTSYAHVPTFPPSSRSNPQTSQHFFQACYLLHDSYTIHMTPDRRTQTRTSSAPQQRIECQRRWRLQSICQTGAIPFATFQGECTKQQALISPSKPACLMPACKTLTFVFL